MRRRALIVYAGYVGRIPGGVVNHLLHLRQGLQARGWDVDILPLESIPFPWRYLPHLTERLINALYPPWGFYARYAVGKRLFGYVASAWGRKHSYALVIYEDVYTAFPSVAPSMCFLHALISDNLQSMTLPRRRLDEVRRYEARLLQRIRQRVATVSDEYRNVIRDTFTQVSADMPDIDVVVPSVDTSRYPFPPAPRPATVLQMVAVGYLYPRKNFAFLVDVLFHLAREGQPVHLTIIGDGPQRGELAARFSRMNLNGHLTWAGIVSSKDMPGVLQRFHVMLHPSLKESFAYALLEAKLAGVYTMTSRLDVPAEFSDQVLPLEGGLWAARISETREDLLSGRWLDRSRDRIMALRKRYSIERMADQVLEMLGARNTT